MQSQPAPNLEMNLREQLLAESNPAPHPSPYPPPPNAQHATEHPYQPSDSASPHDHLDPNVTGQQQAPYAPMSGDSAGDEGLSPQGGKGKRELSTSKRAAQNRAAQRAFRQRKEGYIKKLEEQVKDFQTMEHNFKALQNENYQLREYILNLQSRLLETQSDYPPAPAPSGVNLPPSGGNPTSGSSHPAAGEPPNALDQRLRRELHPPPQPAAPQHHESSSNQAAHDSIAQLRAAAAHAEASQHQSPYGLGEPEYPHKRGRPDEATAGQGDAKAPQ